MVKDFSMTYNQKNGIENLKRFLRSIGLKLTRQRTIILEQVLNTCHHFDADEVFGAIRKKNLRISRATVYRTLAQLEKHSVIRKLEAVQGRSYFEHMLSKKQHEHIYCTQCGKIIEFSDSIMEERIKTVSGRNGFTITNHAFQIFGICDDCRQKLEQQPDAVHMSGAYERCI
jgi:Fur family ferric uptake transcriptional regulator